METKTCVKCGRELTIDHFRNTRWGGASRHLQLLHKGRTTSDKCRDSERKESR